MKVEVKTANNHSMNRDGTERDPHCCGCWNICLDEDNPLVPYAQCNECGEIRGAVFPGIDQGNWSDVPGKGLPS